ncbi:MAG: nuclear transport factor 2 family protein [Chloroflexi bacterium]|nr:nuclear transport factor 2 family protein [Chloroflexota bacterium]
MGHPNEHRLRDLYALFARGDMPGFLAGCTDDVVFTVPGPNQITRGQASAVFTKENFGDLVTPVMQISGGSFSEEVIDVCANDEHGVLLLVHRLQREGKPVEYRTAHVVQLTDGKIAAWQEWPGDLSGFGAAWK